MERIKVIEEVEDSLEGLLGNLDTTDPVYNKLFREGVTFTTGQGMPEFLVRVVLNSPEPNARDL